MKYEEGLRLVIDRTINHPLHAIEYHYSLSDVIEAHKSGYKHALEEAINILFTFGGDEHDKKMQVRDLMNQFKVKKG